MARIRSVHPALFTDEAWVSCSLAARILHIGLWTDADDQGVFEWKPLQLKMRLMPGDAVKVDALLTELAEAGLLRGFAEGGKNFGAIKDFQKWQRPKKPRAIYPLPDDLVGYVTGEAEPQPDLFGGNAGGTGGEKSPQMEDGEERRMEDGGGKRARRDTSLPEGLPDPELIQAAQAKFDEGGVAVDAGREAQRFRDYHLAKGSKFKDWVAAWRSWTTNAIGYAKRDGNVISLADRAPDPEFQRRKFRTWMDDWLKVPGQWKSWERGPAPDEPDCRVPPEIMAEFGHTPVRRAEG